MSRTIILSSLLIVITASVALAQPSEGPAAAWTFNERLRGMVPDASGHDLVGRVNGNVQYADAPGLRSFVFDGATTIQIPDSPLLQAGGALTIDLWIKVADVDQPGAQCITDKAAERHRIWIGQGGIVNFGLKSGGERVDLAGGKLRSGQWHRITATWQRPALALYVDGQEVAGKQWDREPDPGGDFYLGSQGGAYALFRGELDEVRIYGQARPPRAEDKPSTIALGGAAVNAKLTVTDKADAVAVDTGACSFELTKAGVLRSLGAGGQTLVTGNDQPLLQAEVYESSDYDGWRDHATGKTVAATWRPRDFNVNKPENQWSADITGQLDFGGGDALDCRLTVNATAGSPFLSVGLSAKPVGKFTNRFLRSLAVRMPLALEMRKRVVQAGDRGLQWDTRHWFQFTGAPANVLMAEPDHNIWRRFVVDQNSFYDFSIWRSESDATSPLVMQRGEKAPGWMTAYDQHKGLLFGYREMFANAPKALEVRAEGPGEATVYLHSPTQAPLPIDSQRMLFTEPQVTTWMPFAGDFRFVQPDTALAQYWKQESLASDPPARSEIPAANVKLFDNGPADDIAPLISGGVPLPKGGLKDPANVRLRHENADVPLQAKPLAFWPDGSIKWLLVTFPLNGGRVTGAAGEGTPVAFEVNRRDGSKTTYRLDYGGTSRIGNPAAPLKAAAANGKVSIDTGMLQLELAAGESWLAKAVLGGKSLLGPGGVRSFVDFVRPEGILPSGNTLAGGKLDPGSFVAEKIELEEAGPLRAVVRLEGMTTSQAPQRVIVRLEAYAGRSCARVSQTVEFLHKDPRTAFVRRMGLSVPLVDAAQAKVHVSMAHGAPYPLNKGVRAGVRQHSHLGYVSWFQEADKRAIYPDDHGQRSEGYLDATGGSGGVTAVLRDMWQNAPNELAFDRRDGNLTVYFWPESLPPMDMRRYSNYPHRAQGESVSHSSDWVEKSYYPQDPVVGVSRTHEVVLYFHDAKPPLDRLGPLAGDVQDRPLLFPDPKWTKQCGVVQPSYTVPGEGNFPRMDANLEHLTNFWLHHQKLWGWYGLWDYGDIRHLYKSGYGWKVPADELVKLLPATGDQRLESGQMVSDYRPNYDWAFDNGRWGWGNTEGLPNLFFQTQYLRTGDRDLFFLMEAMARHERDVDMRHDGMWFGQGTRHGVQHWSDGNHEERQTTQSETRFHYYLTGDARTKDVLGQLYEKVYSQRSLYVHAAHSGRLQGLLTWWEMTGDPEVGKLLERYVSAFITPEGIAEQPNVTFPGATCTEAKDINSGNMFFWTFGAGHGLLEYFYLTGREDLRDALVKAGRVALAKPKGPGTMLKAAAFAARHGGDPAIEAALKDLMVADHARALQIVPHNPAFYAGPKSFMRSNVPGGWFFMNDEPYVMTALPGDPLLTDEQWAELKRVDAEGGPATPVPYMSWQSEYDRPDLQEYLRIKHPQP